MIGNSRVKKMTSRDDLLQELLGSATSEITQVSKGEQYPTLLKALVVQSMIKIEEDKITVICREVDIDAVKSVVDVSIPPPPAFFFVVFFFFLFLLCFCFRSCSLLYFYGSYATSISGVFLLLRSLLPTVVFLL